jgi:hypothetical protein
MTRPDKPYLLIKKGSTYRRIYEQGGYIYYQDLVSASTFRVYNFEETKFNNDYSYFWERRRKTSYPFPSMYRCLVSEGNFTYVSEVV